MARLYPYQQEAARTLARALVAYGSALDASETGVGKTFTAAGLAASARKPVAVICPKSVVPVWEEVLKAFGCTPLFVLNYEKLRGGRTPWLKVTGAKRKKFAWSERIPTNTIFIWDEIHRCKNATTANAKMLKVAADRMLNLMLSATAVESPLDLRAIGEVLHLFKRDDFYWWARNHGCKGGGFSALELPASDDEQGQEKIKAGMRKIHEAIFGGATPRGVRIRSSSIPGFPENHVISQRWDFGDAGEIKRLYDAMEQRLTELEEKRAEDVETALTVQLRARQEVELLKVPLLAERAEELLAEGKSVAIFVNFNATLDALDERLMLHRPAQVRGEQKDRAGEIAAFQSNSTRVILVNQQAGGASISLHDVHGTHPRVSLICPSFNPFDLLQVLGRIHRNGGTNVTQYFAFAAGTIEERVLAKVLEKIERIHLLNDGGGVIYHHLTAPMPNDAQPITASDDAGTVAASSDTNNFSPSNNAHHAAQEVAHNESPAPTAPTEDGAVDQSDAALSPGRTPGGQGSTSRDAVETAEVGSEVSVDGGQEQEVASRLVQGDFTTGDSVAGSTSPCDGDGTGSSLLTISAPAHAIHGPSGLKMKEKCAQFVNHDVSNPVQVSGSAMHLALETGDDSPITALDERATLEMMRKAIRSILRPFGTPEEEFREITLDIDLGPTPEGVVIAGSMDKTGAHVADRIVTFGTCDRLFLKGNVALMMDYKFGYWPVDSAEINSQAQAYVLGAFQRFPQLREIKFYFLLPRRNEITYHTYTRADIQRITARLRAIIIAAEDPTSEPRPGDALCEFCAKAGDCPALTKMALAITNRYDTTLALPDEVHGSHLNAMDQLSVLLKMAPALDKAIKGWRKRANDVLKAGGQVPGFARKMRGGERQITSPTAAYELVKDRLTPDEFAECADVSLPKLLEKYASKFPHGQKGRAAEALEDAMTDADILTRGEGTFVLSRSHKPQPQQNTTPQVTN